MIFRNEGCPKCGSHYFSDYSDNYCTCQSCYYTFKIEKGEKMNEVGGFKVGDWVRVKEPNLANTGKVGKISSITDSLYTSIRIEGWYGCVYGPNWLEHVEAPVTSQQDTMNSSNVETLTTTDNSGYKWIVSNSTYAKYVTEKELEEKISKVESHNKCLERTIEVLTSYIEVCQRGISNCENKIKRLQFEQPDITNLRDQIKSSTTCLTTIINSLIKLNNLKFVEEKESVIGLTECNRCKTKFTSLEQKADHYKKCGRKWYRRLFFWRKRK